MRTTCISGGVEVPFTSTLAAAQAAPIRTPYVHCVFESYDLGTTHDYTDRWIDIYHKEAEFSGYAYIILQNWDRDVPDLRGYHIDLGWGDVTSAGNEYADTARLWVKGQNDFSMSGKLYTIMYLEDFWELLGEAEAHLGDPQSYYEEYNTALKPYPHTGVADTTMFDIIETAMVAEGLTSLTLVGDDDVIDNLAAAPYLEVNAASYEFYRDVIYRLLMLTYCNIRLKAGMLAETVFPQEADAVDIIYYSDHAPYFKEWAGELKEVVPNHINVFGGATFDADNNIVYSEDGHTWSTQVMGTANDAASETRYGSRVQSFQEPWMNQDSCDITAPALLSRVVSKTYSGSLLRNNDCRIELYDYVVVADSRGG